MTQSLRLAPSLQLACVVLALGGTALARPASGETTEAEPRLSLLNAKALAELKTRLRNNDPALQSALDALRKRADARLTEKPPAVTDKPDPLPVSGDRHDYMSLARYYWPNPNTPDGLPYVNRDGDANTKGINAYDAPRKDRLCASVRDLALAYTLFGEEKYAERAALFLRVFFLDEATRMNPNLNHGQFVPGVTEGRGYGIIETRPFVGLVDAVQLLEGSPHWPASDRDALKSWFGQYVAWLQTSKLGKDEYNAANNHGQWFDAQLVGLARYLGRDEVIHKIAAEEGSRRMAKQIDADGSLPEELRRTRSLHYSLFAIEPWMQIAKIAKTTGADLYSWKHEDGRSLRLTLDYLTPFLLGEKEWTHEQMGDRDYSGYAAMFREAAAIYHEPRFAAVADKLKPAGKDADLNALLGW